MDSIPDDDDNVGRYPTEYLSSISGSSLPPHMLTLKIGQTIVLLQNMNHKQGLCLMVRQLKAILIEAEIIHGDRQGDLKWISRIPIVTYDDDGQSPVKFCRLQFPVRPAFAMTINKAQGQTLESVGVYLHQPVFGHGQLYVALSRCSDPSQLSVLLKKGLIPAMLYSK